MNFHDLLDEYETRYGIADLEAWSTQHLAQLLELVDDELRERSERYGVLED